MFYSTINHFWEEIMKTMKRITVLFFCLLMSMALIACGSAAGSADAPAAASDKPADVATLNIAYQYGLAYAPAIICQQKGLIEKAYKEATGLDVKVNWNQMSSGADINTGIASGDLSVGFMGVAPALTGISKGVGYKIFTNLSGQEHGLMTYKSDISSLNDLAGSSEQIALVNTGSIQHIILGLALDSIGLDAHALDSNIVAMKHPDGMAALESQSIACHLTSNPYIYKERDNSALHEIDEVKNVWSADRSFIVGVASTELQSDAPELYDALCKGISEAVSMINSDLSAMAEITSEFNGNTLEDEIKYLSAGKYTTETRGLFELATFMYEKEFLEKGFDSYSDIVFANVKGD